jgi:hypothetical protein
MKNLFRVSVVSLLAVLGIASAFAQVNTLTQTSLSAAIDSSQTTFVVGSATGIAVTSGTTNGAVLYIVDPGETAGELDYVTSVVGTTIGVRRGMGGTKAVAHTSGAMVLVGAPSLLYSSDPQGSCVTATTLVTPWVNVVNGRQWLCSTVTLSWVPGWGNTAAPVGATLAVASAASAILPSGPLFTSSGTAAITGFTIPVGFKSGSFSIIPTGAFTWTTAGNIGLAGTAVVGRVLTFTWDAAASKFYPSYV